MNGITWIHVAGGMFALLSGAVAVAVRKGDSMHVSAGTWFCVSMFVLGVTASILAPFKSPPESPIGGIMVGYFVATAWMAARRLSGTAGRFEKIACAIVLVIAIAIIGAGFKAALSPPGQFPGPTSSEILAATPAISFGPTGRYRFARARERSSRDWATLGQPASAMGVARKLITPSTAASAVDMCCAQVRQSHFCNSSVPIPGPSAARMRWSR